MKIEILDKNKFKVIPDTFQDKMWIAEFCKGADENKLPYIFDVDFSFSNDRSSGIKGGGSATPNKIYDNLYDAEEEDGVYIGEINDLEITNYEV